tara:strand:+ start:443 stop:559 length:117 start_codon:yes stop_codon:yes gene_type:complete
LVVHIKDKKARNLFKDYRLKMLQNPEQLSAVPGEIFND